jgi:uncharacterized lipoprotein YmbA
MNSYPGKIITVVLAGALLLAAGCSRSPRTNFYTLKSLAPAETAAAQQGLPPITVNAVTLPEYVDRPQFVIVDADNRVDILEQHQWAESLKSAIPRILADNLSLRLATDRVAAYPQQMASDADVSVTVDFRRFETLADSVVLEAVWKVRAPGNKSFGGRSKVREGRREGLDTVAAAYSRALAMVSADIAAALKAELRP